MICPFCRESIQDGAIKCRFCGEMLDATRLEWATFLAEYEAMSEQEKVGAWGKMTPQQRQILEDPAQLIGSKRPKKSDGLAFLLGLLLGPVGLWYKGKWAAGFAWLTMAVLISLTGIGLLAAPVFWLGMAIHAGAAKPI